MATFTHTRFYAWALFAFLAAVICAIGFGQAIGGGIGIAAAVLFFDWLFAVAALVYLRALDGCETAEVHP